MTEEPATRALPGPLLPAGLRKAVVRGVRTRWVEIAVAAVVAGQAVWLGLLYGRGWFFSDDFSFIRFAQWRHLSWSYLATPVNVHLAPGLRLAYWCVAHVVGLNWWPTVAVRLALQALTTVLLFRLLTTLRVDRRVALAVTSLYAFSALLVPSTAYLGNAVNQVPSQLAVVTACLCFLHYRRSSRRRWALGCGLAMLVGAGFWEKSAIDTGCLLVVLAVWLGDGTVRHRIRAAVRDVLGWLLILAPTAAFFVYFLTRHFGASLPSAHAPSAGEGLRLVAEQWGRALWPGAVGGPWHWFGLPGVLTQSPAPTLVGEIVGQLVFAVLAVVAWRRHGRWSLLAWAAAVVPLVIGELIVGAGRFSFIGKFSALDYHYCADLAVPLAVGIGLACGTPPRVIRRPLAHVLGLPPGQLRGSAVVGGMVAVGMVSAGFSGWGWVDRWATSPGKDYTTSLVIGARLLPPGHGLFDVPVPPSVASLLEPYRRVSDLLTDARVPVLLNGGVGTPRTVTDTGAVVPARFKVAGRAAASPDETPVCPRLIQGTGSRSFALPPSVGVGEFFVRVAFFQRRSTDLTVSVTGRDGRPLPVVGSDQVGGSTLAADYVALSGGQPATITLTSNSPATNICVTDLSVGDPVAVS